MSNQDPNIPPDLANEFDAMFERMQTPEGRAAVDKLFNASPEEFQDMVAKGRLRQATFDGTIKAAIDEAINDPDLTI